MYEIVKKPQDVDYLAVTNHTERKIYLGKEYFQLSKIGRLLILEHEKAHAFDKCNEVTANFRALNEVEKKSGYTWDELFFLLSSIIKDDERMGEVWDLKNKGL